MKHKNNFFGKGITHLLARPGTAFSAFLVFVSLWLISDPVWHLAVSTFTLMLLWMISPNPLRTSLYILGLVGFLAALQIGFSPYMRNMFMRALEEGFSWSDWQYLLFAVERFAWPLVMVSTFQSKLNSPTIISQLAILFSPLRWIGLKTDKLQLLIILAMRFIPSLKREWQRFAHFQTYFMTGLPRKSILQKLQYGQGVLKAMISHTIHNAVRTGDLLALRGFPHQQTPLLKQNMLLPVLLWLAVGALFYTLDTRILYLWSSLSAWMVLVPLAVRRKLIL